MATPVYESLSVVEILAHQVGGLSKAQILASGLTVREYNGHCRVSSAARLVKRYTDMLSRVPEADEACVASLLDTALHGLAEAKDAADTATQVRESTPPETRATLMVAEAASNSRPGDAGNHECPALRFARAMAKLDVPEALYALAVEQRDGKALARLAELGEDTLAKRAHRQLGLAHGETLDSRGRVKRPRTKRPATEPIPSHSCGPKAPAELWAVWGARNKGCPSCARERLEIPEPYTGPVSPTWSGLQGDRVAAQGRFAMTGGAGLGVGRISTG